MPVFVVGAEGAAGGARLATRLIDHGHRNASPAQLKGHVSCIVDTPERT